MGSLEEEEKNEEETVHANTDYSDDSSAYEDGSDNQQESHSESQKPLTEEEIEELIAELLEVESKAAEAQEALEEESLVKVEADVRKELAQTLSDVTLEKAVVEEMLMFKEEWEIELDELEAESAHLLEQLDGAGIELSSIYKWIERQTPNVCCTEAWKKRTHWVGTQTSLDATESITQAEEYLQIHRPVRRRNDVVLDEGADGFLGKKFAKCESSVVVDANVEPDWDTFNKMCSKRSSSEDITFGSKQWASVYLASTPSQAAELGVKFPGVDEVEEIDDVDGIANNPFVAAAIANESDLNLTEQQKRNFRKVKEEDDVDDDLKLCIRMKRSKLRKQRKQETIQQEISSIDGQNESQLDVSSTQEDGTPKDDSGHQEPCGDPDEDKAKISNDVEVSEYEGHVVSSSGSGPDDSDGDADVKTRTKGRRKRKIQRIFDDTELGEDTKKIIAIDKERQERLKSLEERCSLESVMMNSMVSNGISFDAAGVEVLGDTSSGYIINLAREKGEEVVRIPPSISAKLKLHQIAGIRFMWENIIQSARKVRSGDKGLGCILAHTMGLGKTLQVIAFLYSAMRSVDLGLKSALIVMPISVLHNWRHEFIKWRPPELKPLRVFMLNDVPREKRVELLMEWRTKGGVFLIGYTAFRNLSLGKYVKDHDVAKELSRLLQAGPDILVCDEAHIIKNTRAGTTQALKQVKCQRRIALTGSPLQNNLMEYYCMVDFVREGFLGSSQEFRNRFQNPIENGQHANSTLEDVKIMNQRSHILHEQLKGFIQRMDSGMVKKDLPPKTVFVVAVKLSPLQRKLYKRFLDVHGFVKDKASGEKTLKRSFFAGYQALAQIWNHPRILQMKKENKDSGKFEDEENCLADDISSDENVDYNVVYGEKLDNPHKKIDSASTNVDWWRDLLQEIDYEEVDYSGKMVLLLDILTMCSKICDKALVFSQSLLTLDLVEFYLSRLPRRSGKWWKKGKDWYRLDGRTESSERQKLVERFNEPSNTRVKCALISTRAGSLGINLPAANRVIIVDGSWNPTYDLQAIYRVWRYGQTKPVFAYRLMAHGTMEEKIYKRQVTKEGLAARVVDRQQVYRTMSKEEILHLFDFGGEDENAEMKPELGQEQGAVFKPDMTGPAGNLSKLELTHQHGTSSDELMQSLISRHRPSWISNYHEHETLLQENEDERLSKEEQDLAWEVYWQTLWGEEAREVPPRECISQQLRVFADVSAPRQHQRFVVESTVDQKSLLSTVDSAQSNAPPKNRHQHKCSNLSHLLTLRSQGTKMGCSTICGECDQEIRWEDLNRDGRLIK